jgi:hypothetical protein
MSDFRDKIVDIIVAMALLPIGASFVVAAMANPNVSGVTGLSAILGLVLIFLGIGLIYEVLPKKGKK